MKLLDDDTKLALFMISLFGIGATLFFHMVVFGTAYYPWLYYKLETFFAVPK